MIDTVPLDVNGVIRGAIDCDLLGVPKSLANNRCAADIFDDLLPRERIFHRGFVPEDHRHLEIRS
eukprot:4087649-Prymnesium_polylepis.1